MTSSITPSTYVRSLGYGMMRQLADFIDPQEGWKKLAADITDSSGVKRYNQMQIRRFEALKQVGKSPTCELLYDWGTLNCTVSDLVDLLIRNQFLAPASLLIPETVLLHTKGSLVEGKKILPELLPLETNEGHLTSNSCDLSSDNNSSHLNDTGRQLYFPNFNSSVTPPLLAHSSVKLSNICIEDLKKQFEQEIKIMAKCQHENLVELLGFSNDFDQPCLVYDYMPNGSLLDRLACLLTVFSPSANILLTESFVPKLSDFGLARASVKFTHTILTDRIVGTAAYMAPEALRGEITPKSDIFSFGVVLLEIITGLRPIDENRDPQLLLSIKEEIEDEEKTIEDYVDKKISNWNITLIEQMYLIASPCLHEKKNRRPDIEKVKEHLKEMLIE
ncbi:putative Interleukin-1 receptor-associated kinase 4 protein [Naja naja]|nr:putative Interleukin-1 receptor-associated kinase 4 protein [Naja naja]